MRRHRGFTLIEALTALTILVVVGYSVFSSFLGTTKAAVKAQSSLNEALLARLILEKITDEVNSNPARIAQFLQEGGKEQSFTVFGYLAPRLDPSVRAPDGSIPLAADKCPFLGGVLDNPALKSAATPEPSPVAAVSAALPNEPIQKAFGDYIAMIELTRQDTSALGDTSLLAEVTTRARVEVYRMSQRAKDGVWNPSMSISTELVTPVESMSTEGAKTFAACFPLYDAQESKAKIVVKLMEQERFAKEPWDDAARSLLASMLLLYRNVRLEHILTKGIAIGRPVEPAPAITPETSLEGLIKRGDEALKASGSSRVRQEVADLNIRNAQTVLDAFKSSQMILQQDILDGNRQLAKEVKDTESSPTFTELRDGLARIQKNLEEGVPDLLSRLAESPGTVSTDLVNTYASSLAELKKLRESYREELKRRAALWLRAQLFRWFMSEPAFVQVQGLLKQYPTRFRDSVRSALALNIEQQDKSDATGLQKLFAAQDAVALRQALRLYDPTGGTAPAAPVASEEEIVSKIRAGNPNFSILAKYTETLSANDPIMQSLPDRFPLYTTIAKNLSPLQESITNQVEEHKRDIDTPIRKIGEMAPTILRSAVELTRVKQILENPVAQTALGLNDEAKEAMTKLAAVSPIDAELVNDVGTAIRQNFASVAPKDVYPPNDWTQRIVRPLEKLKIANPFEPRQRPDSTVPPGSGWPPAIDQPSDPRKRVESGAGVGQ